MGAAAYPLRSLRADGEGPSEGQGEERRQMEAAEQIFDVLGQMKGAAMKVGQVASFIDTGAFPPEFQERIQAKLAELRDAAPRVPFTRMRKLIEDDLREPLTDELDYEHEAQQPRAFARSWRGHPFIYVPPVVTELCSEHVLVSEWVEGNGFEQVKQSDRATRDRFGEIVFRFFFGSLYRNGHFSGDPHPGNYRLMDDGRVAFIDFGMTKRVARPDLEAEIAAVRYGMDGDVEALHRQLGSMGFYDPADPEVTAEAVAEHFHDVTRWYIEDREVTVDRELVSQVLIVFGDPRSRHWQLMRRETMPPQGMLARRMEALTLGVLGQLGATANWHRIAREWLFGDPPSTELGALEEPFHTRAAA